MNEHEKHILTDLENAYTGAVTAEDVSCMVRISRAIAAFKADPECEAEDIFTDGFIQQYYEEETKLPECLREGE